MLAGADVSIDMGMQDSDIRLPGKAEKF